MSGEPMAPLARTGAVLGVDLGDRRIGVAFGDYETRSAVPLTTLGRGRRPEDDARVLARLAEERDARALIVGLPLNMDGSEGPQAARTREWAGIVAAVTGLPVRFRDERLSSVRAEQRVGGQSRGRSGGPPTAARRDAHRGRIDKEAAAVILQDELDAADEPVRDSQAGGRTPNRGG
jgi:putative Holliday junction resolvase